MFNKEFMRYEFLKHELKMINGYCGKQYFAVNKCKNPQECNKRHVERCFYPCIHYYMGNCKYGFNCHFSHSIRRQIVRPDPQPETCKKLYYQNFCPLGGKCKNSHDLRKYACVYNSIEKCKFSDENCRYSHEKKIEVPILCFFNLMGGCENKNCENDHKTENALKYLVYDGPTGN